MQKIKERQGFVRLIIDTEFDDLLRLLAFKVEGDNPAYVVHPYGWGDAFVDEMEKIMMLDCVVAVALKVSGDVNKIWERFGFRMKRMKEITALAAADDPSQPKGLADLSLKYCGYKIDKTNQTANFNVKAPLPPPLINYIATDVFGHEFVDDAITKKLKSSGRYDGCVKYPPNLPLGSEVNCYALASFYILSISTLTIFTCQQFYRCNNSIIPLPTRFCVCMLHFAPTLPSAILANNTINATTQLYAYLLDFAVVCFILRLHRCNNSIMAHLLDFAAMCFR